MKNIILILGIFFYCSFFVQAQNNNTTELIVNNTFPAKAVLLVKCDYNPSYKNNYKFYQIITIPKKGNYKLIVPSSMKKCEVWTMKISLW